MAFSSPFVLTEIERLRRDDGEARLRAWGDNFAMEERLSGHRTTDYQRLVEGAGQPKLEAAHARYAKTRLSIHTKRVAAPFLPGNDLARFAPKDEEQRVIRLEDLSRWIETLEHGDDEMFLHNLDVAKHGPMKDDLLTQPQAQAWIKSFFDAWNTKRDRRPAFAAFRDEFKKVLDGDGWAMGMRDQLGLGHFSTVDGQGNKLRGPILVGLMEMPVSDILAGLPVAERRQAFAAPTTVDGESLSETSILPLDRGAAAT